MSIIHPFAISNKIGRIRTNHVRCSNAPSLAEVVDGKIASRPALLYAGKGHAVHSATPEVGSQKGTESSSKIEAGKKAVSTEDELALPARHPKASQTEGWGFPLQPKARTRIASGLFIFYSSVESLYILLLHL